MCNKHGLKKVHLCGPLKELCIRIPADIFSSITCFSATGSLDVSPSFTKIGLEFKNRDKKELGKKVLPNSVFNNE